MNFRSNDTQKRDEELESDEKKFIDIFTEYLHNHVKSRSSIRGKKINFLFNEFRCIISPSGGDMLEYNDKLRLNVEKKLKHKNNIKGFSNINVKIKLYPVSKSYPDTFLLEFDAIYDK